MKLKALQDTFIKKDPLQSSSLPLEKKKLYKQNSLIEVEKALDEKSGHTKFKLAYGQGDWYLFDKHWDVVSSPNQDKPDITDWLFEVIEYLEKHESLELEAYPDPLHGWSVPTVLFGSTFYPDGSKVKKGDRFTKEEAVKLTVQTLEKHFLPSLALIPTWEQMNSNQRTSLTSFGWNLGANFYGGKGFKSISLVCDSPHRWGDHSWIEEQFIKYRNPGTPVEEGLEKRRKDEARLFCLPVKGNDRSPLLKDTESTLAQKVVGVCEERGFPLSRGEGQINIIGIEGMNLDGSQNSDTPNLWNDAIGILVFKNNLPEFRCLYLGTTEPGSTITNNPYRGTGGVARLDVGHHSQLWQVGQHRGYEALAQNSNKVRLVRDRNKNYSRDDKVTTETGNGINLHTTKTTGWRGSAGNSINSWSAGCVVIKAPSEFLNFMKIIKSSKQYKNSKSFSFDFILLWSGWLS